MFSRWGGFIYRRRRIVLLITLAVAASTAPLALGTADQLTAGGWLDPNSESARVSDRLEAEFGGGRTAFVALFRSANRDADATSPEFQAAIATAVAPLADDPRISGVTGFAQTGSDRFISIDGHAAYVVIGLDMTEDASVEVVDEVQSRLATPAGYTVALTGFGPIQKDSARLSEQDLRRAEVISLPVLAVILVLVFASLIAAAMPLLVAGLAIPTSLALINLIARQTDMSIYVLNIATMLGLALAVDYSLFITSRFREELGRGRTVEQAVTRAIGTAGKAITFSGAAVAIGLSGLLWFRATALSSIGLAGAVVVLCSVVFSLTFLPALLGMIGPRVNALSVDGLLRGLRIRRGERIERSSRWARVAHGVMRHPIAVLVPVLAALLVAGSPFLRIEQGVPYANVYPEGMPSRDTWFALENEFRAGETSPIEILVDTTGPATDAASIEAVMALSDDLAAIDGIDRVEGPFSITDPATGSPMPAAAVARLYAAPAGTLPPQIEAAVATLREVYIRDHAVRLDAISPLPATTPAGTAVVPRIRDIEPRAAISDLQVGGSAAVAQDFLEAQNDQLPWAVGTTLLASALILFLLFGSIAIPIKAVVMTLLSLTASFGALVWIFQEGNLHELLGFEPLGFTIAGIPVIMFATLIGLSMDYEVLLLSRIQEEYRRTGDNTAAVAEGLARTAGVITGAALVMISVFVAFSTAEVMNIKVIGVGMAIAVSLDASIIRVLLVPATMRLLGQWNWWAPGILGRLADRLGFSHVEDEGEGDEAPAATAAGSATTPA